MFQTNAHLLVKGLGDVVGVHLVGFGHNGRRRLRVSLRHCCVCGGGVRQRASSAFRLASRVVGEGRKACEVQRLCEARRDGVRLCSVNICLSAG